MTISAKQSLARLQDYLTNQPWRRMAWPDTPAAQSSLAVVEELIKNTPLFAELTAEEQWALGQHMRLTTFTPHQALFMKDEPSTAFYLVQEGWVKLSAEGDTVIAALGPGSLVGETDFFLARPRTATACTVGKVKVWVLDYDTLAQLVTERPQLGLNLGLAFGAGMAQFQNYLADKLATVPLLQDLSVNERRSITRYLSPQRYAPRETIYRYGDPPAGIFFIEQGRVLLHDQADVPIERIPGQTFGERAVISRQPHADTAQAASEVTVWQLSPADLAGLTAAYPSIKITLRRNLQASLADSLKLASQIIENEISALGLVSGQESSLVQKLHQVRYTLGWLQDSYVWL